jgi:hypothetical protein
MKLVKRWFMKTPEGEILDGPYKNTGELDRAVKLYIKTYKYHPVVSEEDMDADSFAQPEQLCEK